MTLDEARKIVGMIVSEHGPEKAKRVVAQRCEVDDDLFVALALHGATLVEAWAESVGQTKH